VVSPFPGSGAGQASPLSDVVPFLDEADLRPRQLGGTPGMPGICPSCSVCSLSRCMFPQLMEGTIGSKNVYLWFEQSSI
jgi:hypothetical protein